MIKSKYALVTHNHQTPRETKIPLDGLADFDISEAEDGQVLKYDANLHKFVPMTAAGGPGGPTAWGTITGTLSSQTDLMAALAEGGGGGGGDIELNGGVADSTFDDQTIDGGNA